MRPVPSAKLRAAALAACAAVLWLLASACTHRPADPVAAVLDDLERAAEARDADAFGIRLSQEFASALGGKRETLVEIKRYFAAYESVGIEVYGLEPERGGGSAHVRCVVEFSGRARPLFGLQGLLPPSAVYRFDLELVDEANTWRVRQASWERAPAPR